MKSWLVCTVVAAIALFALDVAFVHDWPTSLVFWIALSVLDGVRTWERLERRKAVLS